MAGHLVRVLKVVHLVIALLVADWDERPVRPVIALIVADWDERPAGSLRSIQFIQFIQLNEAKLMEICSFSYYFQF